MVEHAPTWDMRILHGPAAIALVVIRETDAQRRKRNRSKQSVKWTYI
jgi:hypothetical protein